MIWANFNLSREILISLAVSSESNLDFSLLMYFSSSSA